MILYYRNSFWASLVSIVGSLIGLGGIMMLFSGLVPVGIGLIAAAAALLYAAKQISNKKAFDKWWKQIRDSGLESEICRSPETAIAVYQANPEKRTLEKIRSLNPHAAVCIEKEFRKSPKNGPNVSSAFVQTASVQSRIRQPESMDQVRKKENRKLGFLAIAFVALLAVLFLIILQDVRPEAPEALQTEPSQTASVHTARVPVIHGNTEKFSYGSGYTFPTVFAEPLLNCKEFTLEYSLILLDDEPAPEESILCDVYVQLVTEEWISVASYQMDGIRASHRIYLNEPMDIAAVAVAYHGTPLPYQLDVYDPQ